jgi:hypothetical protein
MSAFPLRFPRVSRAVETVQPHADFSAIEGTPRVYMALSPAAEKAGRPADHSSPVACVYGALRAQSTGSPCVDVPGGPASATLSRAPDAERNIAGCRQSSTYAIFVALFLTIVGHLILLAKPYIRLFWPNKRLARQAADV